MNNNRLYVFFGYWIEYTLNPLYIYMKEQGYNCIEILPTTCPDMRKALSELNADEYIFITSAHAFLDNTNGKYNNTNLPPLEAIDILRPVKSVFYPHDFVDFGNKLDMLWLNSIYDIVLLPIDGYSHFACNDKHIYNVGWIKKYGKIGTGTRYKVGHGIGEWHHHRKMGFEHVYNIFRSIWDQGVIVKNTMADRIKLQTFWEEKKVNYIDPSLSIFELIDSCEIILTNGITSVNLESALSGRFTINMLDGIVDQQTHEYYFKGVPNLKIMTISDTAELLKEYYRGEFIPPQGEDILKPFDFEQAVRLITS
jgi:hypothetical protein